MNDNDQVARILDSWYERKKHGEEGDPQELLRAHPELRDELEDRLQALQLLGRTFSRPSDADITPHSVGEFRIVREIGRGGMGVVYEAEQQPMHRRVALKVLAPSITNAARSIKRFQLEARAAGRLHHTNIVPIFSMGQHGGYWYYAMELVEGQSLSQILDDLRAGGSKAKNSKAQLLGSTASGQEGPGRNGSRNGKVSANGRHWYRRIAEVFGGVAEALELAHEQGVVHRDVKPGNLLLHSDGTLKLVDFGLAYLDGNGPTVTRTGDVVGTPAYMSPEQAAAKRIQIDDRTDTYSLGATLYEALTLKPPFEGDTLAQLCSRIANIDPTPPRNVNRRIPKDLETIVLKAMEKDRKNRYQNVGDLARDLFAFCDGGAIQARRVGVVGKLWRRVKRHKVRSALAAAVLVLAVGGAALAFRLATLELDAEYERLLAQGSEAHPLSIADVIGTEHDVTGTEHDAQPSSAEKSWSIFSEAIALLPDRPEAYRLRALTPGDIHTRMSDVDKAEARGLSSETAHWLRAYLHILHEHFDDAHRERALAESLQASQIPESTYVQAIFSSLAGQKERGLAFLAEAIDRSGQVSIIRFLALRSRAAILTEMGRPEEALRDLSTIEILRTDNPSLQVQIASLWRSLENEERATELFAQAFERVRRSDDASEWKALSRACHETYRYDWHDRVSKEAVDMHPNAADLLVDRADSLHHQRDYDGAVEYAQRALAIDDSNSWTYHILGWALGKNGRFADAIVAHNKAIDLKPTSNHFVNLGMALRGNGQRDKAFAAFRTAIDLNPYSYAGHNGLGIVLADSGQTDAAIDAFRKSIKLKPNYVSGHSNLGGALTQKGELDDAIVTLRQAINLRSDYVDTYNNLGAALAQKGELDDAIVTLRQAINLDSEHANAHGNLGQTLMRKREFEEARAALDKAIELKPNAHNYYNLACLEALQGHKHEAFEALSKAADAGWRNTAWMEEDTDLDSLRDDPRYRRIITRMQGRYEE